MSLSISDHCLLVLSIKRRQPQKPAKKRFFFEEMWTREDSCREIVESAWDPLRVDPEFKITDRIKRCQIHLQNWNWNVFGNVHQVLRQKKERLQLLEARDSLHEDAEEIQRVKNEINEVLMREEIMWNQRSRALWIKWGDRNTRFFHATANQRRRKNSIMGLQDSNDVWNEDKKGIERIIMDYFTSIYRSNQPSSFEDSLSAITNRVSTDMNAELIAEFRAEEVWNALQQMHPTKSPGPDGMSPIFFKNYWDIVGIEVVNYVLNALNSGSMPCGINDTFICLIPKLSPLRKLQSSGP